MPPSRLRGRAETAPPHPGDERLAERRPVPEAPARPGSPAAVLALQATIGNAAVSALLSRAPAATAAKTPAARLRELLEDGDENGAIAFMAQCSVDEAGTLLADPGLRALAVKAFDDEEMDRAMAGLKPGVLLAQRLNWMNQEGTSWKSVRRMILDPAVPATQKSDLYAYGWARDLFVDVCDNEEMAEAVLILGGKPAQQLNWMIEEGTDAKLVFALARAVPDADLFKTGLPQELKKGLRSELSGSDYQRAEQMLTKGVLNWGSVDEKHDETHYELKDEKDPTKGYELQDFTVHAKYDIDYSRTELRVKVGIKLNGEKPTPRHLAIWTSGIAAKWNNAFHIENGRRLAIVFEPVFNGPKTHHSVELHKPPIKRADAENWTAGPALDTGPGATQDTTSGDTAAHEFGHLLGMDDEYNLTAADYTKYTGAAPPPGPMPADGYDTTSIMGAHGAVEGRHMRPFVDWLNRNKLPGEKPYKLLPGP